MKKHGSFNRIGLLMFCLLILQMIASAWYDSDGQQDKRKRSRALAFVSTHHCTTIEHQPAQDSYDYETGTEHFKVGRTKYQCEGINNAVSIFDPQ